MKTSFSFANPLNRPGFHRSDKLGLDPTVVSPGAIWIT